MIASTTHLVVIVIETHLETVATTTHLGTDATASHSETGATITHLGTDVTTLSSPQIVLQLLHTHFIKIITSETVVSVFSSKEQKQHLSNHEFKTITSPKDYKELIVHTSLLTENETERMRQKWQRTHQEH